jgi:predicted acetyltransferase
MTAQSEVMLRRPREDEEEEFLRRGYATEILRLSLQFAREKLGIRRLLVTCDQDNIGSMKTIERCGGTLENILSAPDLPKPKRRYWIETALK